MPALWSLIVITGIVLSVSVTVLGRVCRPDNDGEFLEKECWGHVRCVNGRAVVTKCDAGLVLDVISLKCVEPAGRTKECELCSGKADGAYPEYDENCERYFYCSGGQSTSQRCLYIMKFNIRTGLCDVPSNIPPPCGTLGE